MVQVSIVDVGCGFGGLTVALSELFPDKGVLGMEIRMKVSCGYALVPFPFVVVKSPGVRTIHL